MEIKSKLARIVSEVFEIPEDSLTLETGRDDIDAWDSLGHLNFIMSIEKAFKVKFKTEEVEKFETIGDIQSKLQELGAL